MNHRFDCLVCGSCKVDVLVSPFNFDEPVGRGPIWKSANISLGTGGIVSNSGIAMARMGMKTGAFTYNGKDEMGRMIARAFQSQGLDATYLMDHPTAQTGGALVLINEAGERSFVASKGANKRLDGAAFFRHMDVFRQTRMMLIGYYPMMGGLEEQLPDVLAEIRRQGCRTAMDSGADGGSMNPLDRILPHLDVYVPSFDEACHQTGLQDPHRIIDFYRQAGARGIVGVKLGSKGAMLSDADSGCLMIEPIAPPGGKVVDTTGAGDSFYAGLLTGLLKGMKLPDAGRLGAATAACCISAVGATTGLKSYPETAALAGLE